MGAKGMVSFIAIVALLFPLAATIVSEFYRKNARQQLPLGNPSNLERTMDKETFTHSVEKESPIPVPVRRKLTEETPKVNGQTLDIEPIPFAVSKIDTDGITNTTIIITVVSTSVVTFLLATLLFCWYTKAYTGVQNDEKPLPSLSTSTSQKPSYSVQKSNKTFENGGDQLLSSKSEIKKTMSSVNSSVSLGIPLDPPPGNLIASGIAPLKPPPGRPDLALKTPPGMKDLHTPPLTTASPPSLSPAAGTGSAAAPVLSPSILPSAAPFSLHGPSRAGSVRRPPLAAPPPPPPGKAPPPPPPLKQGPRPPPPPVGGGKGPPRPPGVGFKGSRPSPGDIDGDDSNKAKLKPFFWDKVMASPDQAMVWHQIRAGSFQFNEEMIENLFGYNEKNKTGNKKSSQDPSSKMVQLIDGKKAQNLSILLKALNVTTNEVCDALKEGNELPLELIQTLIKMAPTNEEEMKLRLYDGDLSRLGAAEKFLKRLVEIPFAYKRLDSLLFMCTLQEEQDFVKESFQTLEAACKELRKSRLFLKLLEAVLKTGNRMNDGTFRGSAQAFKLDTLLKLSDVKGMDGKTTLLHFVVLEIIRAEGIRAAKSDNLLEEAASSSQDTDEYYRNVGLQEVARLCGELEDVKKAATIDSDGMTSTVSKFGHALQTAREFLNTDLKNLQENKKYKDKNNDDDDGDGDGDGDDDDDDDDDDEFPEILSGFVESAEKDIMWMLEEEKRIMALVKKTADYFHGQAGKDEGLRLFVIVRDFLLILDKVCKEIKETPLKPPPKPVEKKEETKDGSPRRTVEETKVGSLCSTIEGTKDGSPRRTVEEKNDGSPHSTIEETKDGLLHRTVEETKDGSPRRTVEETTDGSPRMTIEDTKDGLPHRTEEEEEERKDGSPHRTVEETKDGSPRMTIEEKEDGLPRRREEWRKDGSPHSTTVGTDEGSPHRTVEETKDGSPHRMMETKDVLSPSTQISDAVPHKTHMLEGDGVQDSWRNKGMEDKTQESEGPREVDDLQDSWKEEDSGHDTSESEGSWEIDNLQDFWKNNDPQDSWKEEDSGHDTPESEGPREVDDLQDTWKNDDLQDSWKEEDSGHAMLENQGPQEVDDLHDSWNDEDSGHETLGSEDLREVYDLQDSWKNVDSGHNTRENENPPPETEEIKDLLHDSWDTKPPNKNEESDDLGLETLEYDDNLQHKTQDDDDDDDDDDFDDDNDDLQPKTHEDEDLEFNTPEPNNSQHTTPKDDVMEPNTLQNETREMDDLQNETRVIDDLQNETREIDDLQNETRKIDNLQSETPEINDFQNETREIDDLQNKTREIDNMQSETPKINNLQSETLEIDDLQNKTQKIDNLQNETREIVDLQPSESHKSGFRVPNERLIPAIALRRVDTFNSDENSTSDED
ncbi:hypothetical protein LXL04_037531 [Taraxacum kok-saghyz]